MKIFIFGNPDLTFDSLPLRILSDLQKAFPDVAFEVKDPNEEWEVPEEIVIIDTAVGIKDVTVFHNLKNFSKVPNLSMHDFDALTNLRYLEKLGRLKKITIVAIPPEMGEEEAFDKVSDRLNVQLNKI